MAAVSAAGCFVPVNLLMNLGGSKGKNAKTEPTAGPAELAAWEPAPLEVPPGPRPAITSFRVRVLADDEYRAATLHWEDRARQLVGAASEYLEARLGARLS